MNLETGWTYHSWDFSNTTTHMHISGFEKLGGGGGCQKEEWNFTASNRECIEKEDWRQVVL